MQELVSRLLAELGEDPLREGLRDTPKRVEKSLKFLTSGYRADIDEVINNALFSVDYSEMVIVKDIDFYSLCEHHLLPFFGKCHIAYIPQKKVIGLSKIPRLVDVFARRLQVQERLTHQVAEVIEQKIAPLGVAVVMEGTHLCMSMRGVEKQNSLAITSAMLGAFRDNARTRSEFLELIRRPALNTTPWRSWPARAASPSNAAWPDTPFVLSCRRTNAPCSSPAHPDRHLRGAGARPPAGPAARSDRRRRGRRHPHGRLRRALLRRRRAVGELPDAGAPVRHDGARRPPAALGLLHPRRALRRAGACTIRSRSSSPCRPRRACSRRCSSTIPCASCSQPVVIEVTRLRRLNPLPVLLALATGSNIGSVATITGNPQQMLIGSVSRMSFVHYAAALGPVAVVGLLLETAIIATMFRGRFFVIDYSVVMPARGASEQHRALRAPQSALLAKTSASPPSC
jgi:GTP cyclohydrolase I